MTKIDLNRVRASKSCTSAPIRRDPTAWIDWKNSPNRRGTSLIAGTMKSISGTPEEATRLSSRRSFAIRCERGRSKGALTGQAHLTAGEPETKTGEIDVD